jgi:hypothetical protein
MSRQPRLDAPGALHHVMGRGTQDRRHLVLRARRLFYQLAVRGMGDAGVAEARFLGMPTSTVNRLAVSPDLP